VALLVRTWFADRGLDCFPKVSGSKGMQVYVPLNTPSSYEVTQPLARRVAEDLERSRPKQIISRMSRADRAGKVFIDWSQNAAHKTTVSVYSLRAKREQPFVSMPISWKEIESALSDSKPEALVFTPEEAVKRDNRVGDLFAPVLNEEQTLPKELLRELGLAETEPRTVTVTVPEQQQRPYSLPRSSGQGGRKLFVVHRGAAGFELGLEVEGSFRTLTTPKLPKGKEAVTAHPSTPQELTYLTEESSEGGIVWDLGTYEVVEGSYARGDVIVYLSGRKFEGQWHLTQTLEGEWRIRSQGARIKRDLPVDGSSLPAATKATGRHGDAVAARKEDRLPGSNIPLAALPAEEPRFVKKMDCVAVNRVEDIPSGLDWTREVKWDGYRVCVVKRAGSVAIRTKGRVTKGPEGVKKSVRAQMNSMNVDDLKCFRRRSSAFIGGTPTGLAL
jgi:hypothetical protein